MSRATTPSSTRLNLSAAGCHYRRRIRQRQSNSIAKQPCRGCWKRERANHPPCHPCLRFQQRRTRQPRQTSAPVDPCLLVKFHVTYPVTYHVNFQSTSSLIRHRGREHPVTVISVLSTSVSLGRSVQRVRERSQIRLRFLLSHAKGYPRRHFLSL